MSSTTTNYNLHKIDLADSPPDITVLNENWDKIDEKLNEHDNLTASDVGAVPLDGSVPMSGGLQTTDVRLGGDFAKILTDSYKLMLDHFPAKGDANNKVRFRISSVYVLRDVVAFEKNIDGTVDGIYRIFGEHNKPSGSYTGNGSATGRTITTNAVGDAILVWRADTHVMTLVSPKGAIVGQTSGVKYIASTYVYVNSYNLVMATTDTALNESGKTYYYKVL